MEVPIVWSKVHDKLAHILVLSEDRASLLKVTGMSLTLKKKVRGVLEALGGGQDPSSVDGAKLVESLDLAGIRKAAVSPGGSTLTLYGPGDSPRKLSFATPDDNADGILQAILAQANRTFRSEQEEIGAVEALTPPLITGLFAGLLWAAVYFSAVDQAAGKLAEVRGRHRALKELANWVAGMLGTTGSMALGVVLLVLIVGWAAARIVRRPERTVWVPES